MNLNPYRWSEHNRDLVIVSVLVVTLFVALLSFEAFEILYEFTRAHEDIDLDEVILFVLCLPLPLAWFAYRRAKEVRRTFESNLRLERELAHAKKIQSLGILSSGIAHELNNQLQPAQTVAELLNDGLGNDDPLRPKYEVILASVGRAKTTVNKILAFARRDNGEPGACEVGSAISDLEELLRLTCPINISLNLEIERPIGDSVLSAEDLDSVVINLVSNAIDAIGQDQGDIVVDARRVAETSSVGGGKPVGAIARIRVTDSGCGLDDDSLEQVFDPFYTTKPVGRGTGLGLWQVKNLIDAAGGRITVQSEIGEGTIFTIDVPVAAS